ncbi:MAG: DUF3383 domain-containing protein [Syntrophomonadaceae bacterium]|nr:DUF3383 domain-containing protein [Syntrophomonadaceae bacterium]
MAAQLPSSSLVSVAVNLASTPAQAQSLSNLLVLGSSDVINVVERMRTYSTLSGVATDFGTTAPEYLAATEWFGQTPQPGNLLIGRWAATATAGLLIGATLSAAQQLMTTWQAVTAGAFNVTIDGTASAITGLNFSAVTNLNGVASTIQTAIVVVKPGATVVWNASYERFEFKSGTTGATSKYSFLSAPATGTDISAMLGGTATSSGAYVVDGIAIETAVSAAALFDSAYGQQFYGLFVDGAQDADHLAIAAYVEGANTKHAYGVNTQEAAVLVASDTTNIAYQLKQLGYKKTLTQYSSNSKYAVVSLMARILTTDYTANNTVITLMYKTEPGVVAEQINSNQLAALTGFNCNVFVAYDNNTAIIQNGVVASGDFIDTIFGADWLAIDIQNSVYNLLYSNPTKIPQTDAGNHIIATTIELVCAQGVTNGLLAPGTWTQPGFGSLKQNDFLSKGYYVYAPPISSQNPADRAARKSVTFQVAAKLAGAIHTVDVIVNINR